MWNQLEAVTFEKCPIKKISEVGQYSLSKSMLFVSETGIQINIKVGI